MIGIKKIENKSDIKEWRLNGVLHRDDGPTVECFSGHKEWYKNGKRHRDDGPAVEYSDGDKSWYISGYCIYEIKLDLIRDYDNCVGQFLYKKEKDYLILCFERENHYFYTALWKDVIIDGKRYDCSLEDLKSLL